MAKKKSRDEKKVNLNRINKFVQEKHNGKCISTEYIQSGFNLWFECKYNHKWEATWNNIFGGKWCPYCSQFAGERLTRAYFEQIFNLPFPRFKPDWLISPKGYKMELDGFNEELNLAFEHQGMQHYKINEFAKTQEKLDQIQAYDALKKQLCQQNNIKLLIIPQIPQLTSIDRLPYLIQEECQKLNINVPDISQLKFNIDLIPHALEYLNLFKNIAKEKGGECLSTIYINYDTKLTFKCKNNHQWEAWPQNIRNGHWCSDCRKKRLTLPMEEICQKYMSGTTIPTLKKEYNVNRSTIVGIIEDHNLKYIPPNIDKEIINEYLLTRSVDKVLKKFKTTHKRIINCLKLNNFIVSKTRYFTLDEIEKLYNSYLNNFSDEYNKKLSIHTNAAKNILKDCGKI